MHVPRPVRTVLRALSIAAGFLFGAGAAQAEPAMWVVKDADSTVYLLGTIHVMKPGVTWRSGKLDAALKSSDEYWMEADVGGDPAVAQTYILNFGMDSRRSLADAVGEAQYAKLLAVAKRYDLPTEQFPRMRPWLASMALSRAQMVSVGYDPERGVDLTLERDVMAAGKPVKGFETIAEHFDLLADMPDKIATQMLLETLDEVDQGEKLVDELEAAWLAGDVKKLQRLSVDKMRVEAPELFEILILRRNANWVKQIDALLKGSGTQFIAVGTAHLVGRDSVPEQLGKLGYKVARY